MEPAPQSPYEQLTGRRFAFYPALRNIEHNEWTLEKETWSEMLAKNVETGVQLWIPRAYLGEVSSTDEPVLIVGLKRELEVKSGEVRPYRKRVVDMPGPSAVRQPRAAAAAEPAPPVRGEMGAESRTFSLIGRSVAAGLFALLLILLAATGNLPNPIEALFRADTSTADQRYLSLSAADGYYDIQDKVGRPEQELWLTKEEADLHFQALAYPERRYVIILMGGTRQDARYVGTLHDPTRKILDSARLSGGGNTAPVLRNLPEF